MKFSEAMVHFEMGSKIRCVDWEKDRWIQKGMFSGVHPNYVSPDRIGEAITWKWELYRETEIKIMGDGIKIHIDWDWLRHKLARKGVLSDDVLNALHELEVNEDGTFEGKRCE